MTNLPPTAQKPKNIWYKNYMVLVFVIGFPLLMVITCIIFVVFAVKVQDSTVRDDWYMDGKALYADASKDKLAYDLGVAGIVKFNDNEIEFLLNYPKDSTETGKLRNATPLRYPDTLKLVISHATDKSQDQDLTLTHSHDNVYRSKITTLAPAKYYITITSDEQKWRLMHASKLPKSTLSLVPLDAYQQKNSELPDQRDRRFAQTQTQTP